METVPEKNRPRRRQDIFVIIQRKIAFTAECTEDAEVKTGLRPPQTGPKGSQLDQNRLPRVSRRLQIRVLHVSIEGNAETTESSAASAISAVKVCLF